MTFYMKSFVFASLIYLGLAVIFGVLNGMTDIGYFGVFAHTHFNLLGFMSMIIFGIGYFILPRFNGVDLKFPSWVAIHFYLGNISLIGMVAFRGIEIETGEDIYTTLFIIFAALQAISIFMFIINIWVTLTPKKVDSITPAKKEPAQPLPTAKPITSGKQSFVVADESTMPNMSVTPETKVADLVDRLPSLLQVIIDCGLMSLQMPGHIDKVRQMGITLGMAAANHSLDIDAMILKIETELQSNGFTTNRDFGNMTNTIADVSALDTNTLIGEVIANYPKSTVVFQKYFGDGCFECPGQSYESIDMACRIHNVDPQQFLKEIKEALS